MKNFRSVTKTLQTFNSLRIPYRSAGGDCGGGSAGGKKGVVLGVYDGCSPGEYKLTTATQRFDEVNGGKINTLIKGTDIKAGTCQVFANVSNDFNTVAVSNIGNEGVGYNELEKLDECKENIRVAAAVGARALQNEGMTTIFVEGFTNAEPAAEGSLLSVWRYQEQRSEEGRFPEVNVDLFDSEDRESWQRGKLKADCQNLARRIEETPSNLMTPSIFAGVAIDTLCPCGVAVDVRDKDWIESSKMSAFLSISKGSCEPPLLLEMGYCGGSPDGQPIVLSGKGITFDSGGLCLKNCPGMSEYRGDLAGAAVVLAVMKCVAMLSLPINVIGLIPLCENMIGGMATKPGDVVMSRNGKTIKIEDTDNEGRVVLADILPYACYLKPCLIVNVATLTPGMKKTLGTGASGTFTNSHSLYRELERAGSETGDRVWRFPFWRFYTQRVTDCIGVDVTNVGKGVGGGPCLGAAFLKEFITNEEFIHLDITGTGMLSNGVGHPYLRKGLMTGRPVRTIVQFLYQIACPHDKGDDC
ncbi:cytosol aminopeptidase-like [Cimex lectularius]|uniref:Cytosol aminopeptidase n=1 Tax=Cimex lectularius TaxID=79782 RepID=A0A8I6TD95_CIMLE|nr:cytosol aminopeptidase-like [Cimex lectularius]